MGIFSNRTPAAISTEYTTEELLGLALKMLDVAAQEQRGERARGLKERWLTNNTTLEVIRYRVENPTT